jgi:hypothetical protein
MTKGLSNNIFGTIFSKWTLGGLLIILIGNLLIIHRQQQLVEDQKRSKPKDFDNLEKIKIDIFPKLHINSLSTANLYLSKPCPSGTEELQPSPTQTSISGYRIVNPPPSPP